MEAESFKDVTEGGAPGITSGDDRDQDHAVSVVRGRWVVLVGMRDRRRVRLRAGADDPRLDHQRLRRPEATVPALHRPVAGLYVPWLGIADTNDTPAGRASVTCTFVAASGPLLLSVMV